MMHHEKIYPLCQIKSCYIEYLKTVKFEPFEIAPLQNNLQHEIVIVNIHGFLAISKKTYLE